jgi:hypothetical protein
MTLDQADDLLPELLDGLHADGVHVLSHAGVA